MLFCGNVLIEYIFKELEMFFYEPFKVTKYIDSDLLAKTASSVLHTLGGVMGMLLSKESKHTAEKPNLGCCLTKIFRNIG